MEMWDKTLTMGAGIELDKLVVRMVFKGMIGTKGPPDDLEVSAQFSDEGGYFQPWMTKYLRVATWSGILTQWSPSRNIKDAWDVLRMVEYKWPYNRKVNFFDLLTKVLDWEYREVPQWPDVLLILAPHHICKAAVLTEIKCTEAAEETWKQARNDSKGEVK